MSKKFFGFTLAEMMVVMLIMTIVLAMAAPLMTKRRVGDASTDSPWAWVHGEPSDAYFRGSRSNGVAMIGQTSKGNDSLESNAKLIINQGNDNDKYPIVFKRNGNYLNLAWGGSNSLRFGGPYSSAPTKGYNTAFGIDSMNSLADGEANTAFGYRTLTNLISGSSNVAFGSEALYKNTTGDGNVAVGRYALYNNTTGNNNVAFGSEALKANTTGNYNVAFGGEALKANTTGSLNVAFGDEALKVNTTGKNNVAVGSYALYNNTTGNYNVAIGSTALYDYNYTNDQYNGYEGNVAIGNSSLSGLTEGKNNEAIGVYSLSYMKKGEKNIAIGSFAGEYLKEGNSNTAIGYAACLQLDKSSNKTCIGAGSGPATNSNLAKDGDDTKVIFLGDSDTTVYIPGHLVVEGNTLLAAGSSKKIFTKFSNTVGELTGSDGSAVTFTTATLTDTQIPIYSAIYSDKRLKNISGENKVGLDKIRELRVFNFTFKKDKSKTPHVGVIAQDLENVFPDAVTKDDDGYLMIRMEDMFYSAINAIKELDNFVQGILNELKIVYAKITGLDTRIQTLEKENKQLKETNKQLEKANKQLQIQISDIDKRLKKLEK